MCHFIFVKRCDYHRLMISCKNILVKPVNLTKSLKSTAKGESILYAKFVNQKKNCIALVFWWLTWNSKMILICWPTALNVGKRIDDSEFSKSLIVKFSNRAYQYLSVNIFFSISIYVSIPEIIWKAFSNWSHEVLIPTHEPHQLSFKICHQWVSQNQPKICSHLHFHSGSLHVKVNTYHLSKKMCKIYSNLKW